MFKQWALDVGLWEAEKVEQWRWMAFRPFWWNTPTNATHRAYRDVVTRILTGYTESLQIAYGQGVADALEQIGPLDPYDHHLLDPRPDPQAN
jgi:hypothetical protein